MSHNYHDLSVQFQKGLLSRQENEKACALLVRQFAQGFIDQFQWPATLIAFVPHEGNAKLKEVVLSNPNGIHVAQGPGEAMHFEKGAFHLGLAIWILPASASPPAQLLAIQQGTQFFRIRTPIKLRAEDSQIVLNVGNRELKLDPANAALEFQPLYEGFLKDFAECIENYELGLKLNQLGFHMD